MTIVFNWRMEMHLLISRRCTCLPFDEHEAKDESESRDDSSFDATPQKYPASDPE